MLRELLAEAVGRGVDVRVLLWAGAPFRAFTPARADVRADADELARGTGVRIAVDSRERLLHCHHEKVVVVDDEVAFVGGVDLTDLGGDRWDTPAHPARGRLGWHDAGTRLRGPVVADVAEHFDLRWTAVTGELSPEVLVPPAAGGTTVQLLRTIPEHVYDEIAGGAFGILEGYMRALRSARELIYLESQFFWLPELVSLLSDMVRDPPGDRFRLVVLLPSKPNNGEEDTRGMLAHLADADAGRGRFLATTVDAMTGSTVDQLYVHAKIGIVDDRWLTIGSANLNAHSFFNDTEVNVQVADPALARATRLRLWSEHLGVPEAEIGRRPGGRRRPAVAADRPGRARAPAGRRAAHAPASRAHARLPQARAAARADGRRRGRRLSEGCTLPAHGSHRRGDAGARAARAGPDRSGAVEAWGPYLSERQWGTVREDYSAGGDAWRPSRTTRRARAPTGGARTASPGISDDDSGCAWRSRCGTARTRSSRSGSSA